jgi:hypothetical protein
MLGHSYRQPVTTPRHQHSWGMIAYWRQRMRLAIRRTDHPQRHTVHPSHCPSTSHNIVTAALSRTIMQQSSACAASTIRSPLRRTTRRREPWCTSQTASISTRGSVTTHHHPVAIALSATGCNWRGVITAGLAPAASRIGQARSQQPSPTPRLVIPAAPTSQQLLGADLMSHPCPRVYQLNTRSLLYPCLGDLRAWSALLR